MKIENIKAKIRENQERKFLLDKKSKVIEKDIEHGQEVLTMARNLTPVEMEASANPDEITVSCLFRQRNVLQIVLIKTQTAHDQF